MTREEAIVMQKAIRDNLHETGKDYPYRDDMIPLMKESCDIAIKSLEQESVSREVYDHEYALRKEFEIKAYKLQRRLERVEHNIDKIKAEIEQTEINGHIRDIECFRAGINVALNVIDKYKAGSEQ